MEVRIQCDDNALFPTGYIEDDRIGCGGQRPFSHVRCVNASRTEREDSGTRKALIEEQLHQRCGRGKTLSSTRAAAKASAWRISSSSSSGYSRLSSARSG